MNVSRVIRMLTRQQQLIRRMSSQPIKYTTDPTSDYQFYISITLAMIAFYAL